MITYHPPVIGGQEDVIVPGAVMVAGACPDEHHLTLEDVPLWAPKIHLCGAGGVRGAAAAIRAAAAELGSVGVHAGAAGELQVNGLAVLRGPHTLLSFLGSEQQQGKG